MKIFCEGEKTEPNYINGYINKTFPGNRTLKVIEVVPTKKNTPRQLVDEAVKMKKEEALPGDEFWVVYDRESEQKYSRKLHAQARQKAQSNDVHIALSNRCFEVWILLHFQETVAPFTCFDDLKKNSPLKKHIPDYDKADKNLFKLLCNRVQAARQNAPKMNQNTKNAANPGWTSPDEWNPYTNMHELLDAIDRFQS